MCFKEACLDIFVTIYYIVTIILVYILLFLTSRGDINLYYFHKIICIFGPNKPNQVSCPSLSYLPVSILD